MSQETIIPKTLALVANGFYNYEPALHLAYTSPIFSPARSRRIKNKIMRKRLGIKSKK